MNTIPYVMQFNYSLTAYIQVYVYIVRVHLWLCVHVHTPQARFHTDSVKTDRAKQRQTSWKEILFWGNLWVKFDPINEHPPLPLGGLLARWDEKGY